MRNRLILAVALLLVVGIVLTSLLVNSPPVAAEPRAAQGRVHYEYGQLTHTVYFKMSKEVWRWNGPEGTRVKADSASELYEKLSGTKKEAKLITLLNWLGSQGWQLAGNELLSRTTGDDDYFSTNYIFKRP